MRVIDSAGALRISNLGGDLVAPLLYTEVAITGGVTLTSAAFGYLHKITGTSGDYTINLPAVAGNAGKFIGFYVGDYSVATKKYTLDGNGSENIDGILNLTMMLCWDNRVILYCDGSGWRTINATFSNGYQNFGNVIITGSSSNPTKGSITDWDSILCRRTSRNTFEVTGDFYQASGSGGAAGSGSYLYQLPFGLSFDTTNFVVDTDASTLNRMGTHGNTAVVARASSAGSGYFCGNCVMYSATLLRLIAFNAATLPTFVGSAFIPLSGQASYSFNLFVPVAGW